MIEAEADARGRAGAAEARTEGREGPDRDVGPRGGERGVELGVAERRDVGERGEAGGRQEGRERARADGRVREAQAREPRRAAEPGCDVKSEGSGFWPLWGGSISAPSSSHRLELFPNPVVESPRIR